MKKYLGIFIKIVLGILLAYSVIFSIVGTYLVVKGVRYIMAPIKQVKELVSKNPIETSYMTHYRLELQHSSKPSSFTQVFIPLDSISPNLIEAVLAAEDDGFYLHPGFDLEAIISANEYNMRSRKIKRGGSTITQQVAKNLFLNNNRNFERKFKELAYSLLMEKYLGKKRILEIYMNYAQWGPALFGCEAAAHQYFKKSSSKLSRNESVRLAAILSSPIKVSPLNTQSTILAQRVQVIANNLYSHHQINDSGYESITGVKPDVDSSLTDSSSGIDQ